MTRKLYPILFAATILLTACTNHDTNVNPVLSESIIETETPSSETQTIEEPKKINQEEIEQEEIIQEKIDQEETTQEETSQARKDQEEIIQALTENNPIDNYFNQLDVGATTVEITRYTSYYTNAWETELFHAYDLFAEQTRSDFMKEEIIRTRDAYMEYVNFESNIKAHFWFSDAFDTSYSDEDGIIRGRLLPCYRMMFEGQSYREQTIYLYSFLNVKRNWNIEFLFDAEAEAAKEESEK